MQNKIFKRLKPFLSTGEYGVTVLLGISFFKWAFISSFVGVLTGSSAALFLRSLDFAINFRGRHAWLLFLLPFGGAFVSFLYAKFGKNSTKGNNLIIDNINSNPEHIPLRMAPFVFFGTFITHLFGGSAGREGTGVQIGSSIASFIGTKIHLDETDTKIMLMCGISSGFASVFGTPLAGTIFGLEVAVLGTMNYSALIPCFIAAFAGNLTTELWGIHHVKYVITQIPDISYLSVAKIVFAAVLFGLISKLFSELTHKLKDFFGKHFENASIKSFMGGIIILLFTLMVGTKDYLSLSLPLIQQSFSGHVNPMAFVYKLIFTSFTLGTGFQGGEVTPLFVIGSTSGNMLSGLLHMSPSLLAGLGLIGVFAGATNTPITSFVLGLEMFGSSGMEYMFMTCAISYLFSGHSGIYTSQMIGISKTKLVRVPKRSTLAYFKKKKPAALAQKNNLTLAGQFQLGISSVELPASEGLNVYKFQSTGKGVRLIQRSYNPDGGMWSASPINGRHTRIDLKNGTEEIHMISISQSHGKPDKLFLVNANLFSSVPVKYALQPVEHRHAKHTLIPAVSEKPRQDVNVHAYLPSQFHIGKSSCVLPNPVGENIYSIKVNSGKIRFSHHSFNPDGGTYSAPPSNRQKQYYDLTEGVHEIRLTIEEHYGHPDQVILVNESFKNASSVEYSVQKASEINANIYASESESEDAV